jgi:polysaccharide biosynthesis protein PslH
MKILQLCKKFPYPMKDGEAIAITHMSRAMNAAGAEVSLLAMNTTKHYFDMATLPKSFNHYSHIWTANVDNRIKPIDAFFNLFSSQSYHIQRFISDEYAALLRSILQEQQFDVIQLETLYLTPYIDLIRAYSDAKIVLRSHNVEFEIWERLTVNEPSFLRKKYLQHLTKKLRDYEIAQLQKIDAVLAITERDLESYRSYGFEGEGKCIPIGLDVNSYKVEENSFHQPLSISFIGSLDWQPNIEGLRWFLNSSWKILHKAFPTLEFHIAGRNTPEEIKNINLPNVIVHGEVPDAQAFIAKHTLMLVPLLSGGGMRAKILEAMALGKVVLSTKVGIEGIPVINGEEAYIANSSDEFRAAIHYCYAQNGELAQMGKQARLFIERNYDNRLIADKVLQFYYELCKIELTEDVTELA